MSLIDDYDKVKTINEAGYSYKFESPEDADYMLIKTLLNSEVIHTRKISYEYPAMTSTLVEISFDIAWAHYEEVASKKALNDYMSEG